ncbi:MAG: hypothetical protein A9Z00_02120 [Thermobacillus sp. ZCTH02-B1]|uniref:TetR/AcrR family transcriptional regulator n=1 Tax=Thermobacillus sp. ZCTH02-B1 TaxID=1858795 RepID=UPI000B555F31|nr:TetR/AcrR family transcriptional regulator [Thermobacillus sp. ZCTH02-B1]OUM94381.1 MAG: hypothetical protein A9Z00_02120 [Thermobacillus sp. ZCTH02-B1]
MPDRKRLIVAAAQRVFARKGYRSASMREIAEEAGVAKGSIYLHFKSKDELALAAVADVYDRIRRRMAELEADEDLTPRERFIRQLEEQLATGSDNAEWIRRLWREHADGIHEALPGFVLRIRAETTEWLLRSIRDMYGEPCAPYAGDIALMMQGALGEVVGCHLLGGKPIEPQRLARYLVRRMDDIAAGLIGSGERPLVEGEELDALMRRLAGGGCGPAAWQASIRELRGRLGVVRAGADAGELEEALDLLAAEATKLLPNRVALRALLGHVRALAPEPLRPDVDRLERDMFDG